MTGAERIQALLEGNPIDRTPVSGWYHMPLVDRNAEEFVKALIDSTDRNRWDFIKVMSNGHFYTEAFGGEIRFSQTYDQWNGTVLKYPIRSEEDAWKLPVLELDNPVWQRELKIVRGLKEHYGEKLPILATLFNPLTAVQDCMGYLNPKPLLKLMEENPEALHHALEVMTQTNLNYLNGLFEAGVDGIFLANQYAAAGILTDEQYEEFCHPYEARVLEYCKGHTWFNMVHIHGTSQLRMERYLEYGDDVLHALNWENCPADVPGEEVTTIADVRGKTKKIIAAGIDHKHDFMSEGGREAIRERLKERFLLAKKENGDNRFLFTPGCVLPTGGSEFNVLISEVAEELGKNK